MLIGGLQPRQHFGGSFKQGLEPGLGYASDVSARMQDQFIQLLLDVLAVDFRIGGIFVLVFRVHTLLDKNQAGVVPLGARLRRFSS